MNCLLGTDGFQVILYNIPTATATLHWLERQQRKHNPSSKPWGTSAALLVMLVSEGHAGNGKCVQSDKESIPMNNSSDFS